MEEKNYIYKGAIHIHTKLSDGTGDLNSITKAAKKAGLDWIIITDHNYIDSNEGIINGVYVIKEQEISPKCSNHYLAFGLNEKVELNENPQVYVDKVRELGGFGFAAHPDEGYFSDRNGKIYPRKNSHHCIPWTDKNLKPDGVEIWNWFSNWADNLNDSNILSLAFAYFFKHKIVKSPSKLTLDWWDKLNSETEKIIPALGGVDAHALKFYRYILPVTVFPYKTCFSTITNFIYLPQKLSDNFITAKEQILNAIKQGNNTISNSHICNELPNIYITNSKNTFVCGETIEQSENCCLHFESNRTMEVCLIYNGKEMERFHSDNFIRPITKSGKYRIECYYNGMGYLYTNPFYIKEKVKD